MSRVAEKDARFGFRTTIREKVQIERAARLRGLNPTAFARDALNKAAHEAIQEYETMTLAEDDREAFIDALLNPPAPNAYLLETVAIGKRLLGDD